MRNIILATLIFFISCKSENNNVESLEKVASMSNLKQNNISSRNESFIQHYKDEINFNKCKLYATENYNDYSKRQKKSISDLHAEIQAKGVTLYNPIEVIEHKGNSSEIAFDKRDIDNISQVFNTKFDETYQKALEFSKNSKFETNSEEFHQNGKIRRVNKSFKGNRDYNNYYQENNNEGEVLTFGVEAENQYKISFIKNDRGEFESKELKIFGDKLGETSFQFKESFSGNSIYGLYSLGSTINSVSSTIENNILTSLNQKVNCGCPSGKDPDHGVSKMIETTIIEYSTERGEKKIMSYWDSGKFVQNWGDQVFDLNNNTFKYIEWKDKEAKDTSAYTLGILQIKNKTNGQENLYGVNSFINGKLKTLETKWTTDWEGAKEIKYKYTETTFNDQGYPKETIYYFPNGNVKSRENR